MARIPKSVLQFALKHRVNVGRDSHGVYFVRDPATGKVVETTASGNATAANALAMIRRYLRRKENPRRRRRGITGSRRRRGTTGRTIAAESGAVAASNAPPARARYRATYRNRTVLEFNAASDARALTYARGLGAHKARSTPKSVLRLDSPAIPPRAASKRSRRRNPSPRAELETAARAFEEFTGHEATRVERHKGVRHRAGFLLGRVAALSYIATRDDETAEYQHRFKRRSRPQLVSSHDGSQLYLLGGAYSVTDRGIEDA